MDPKNTLPIKVAILADPEIVIFGAVKLPPALIKPAVKMFPPVIFAAEVIVLVAEIKPAVNRLPPVILAALVIVLVADINPAVKILAPTILPVVLTSPLDVIEVNVPTEVIFGCAFVVTVAAVPTALPALKA